MFAVQLILHDIYTHIFMKYLSRMRINKATLSEFL